MTWNTNEAEHIAEYEENDSTSFRHSNNSDIPIIPTPIRNKDYKGMIIMIESLIVGGLLRMIIKTILTLTQTPLIANIYLLKVPLTGQSPTLNSCKTLD